MNFKYITDLKGGICLQGFASASAEELRVLVAIIATEGKVTDAERLASLASVSKPRALAALALWEGEGVIIKADPDAPEVIDEFKNTDLNDGITEETAIKVAKDIRNHGLATMLEELAKMTGACTLSTPETKKITALYTQYSLDEAYILTLAAYLKDKNKLTVTRLVNEAVKLVGKEIDSLERLEIHLEDKTHDRGDVWEIRRILGISGTLSPKEKELFGKWCDEFGYGAAIITEAYNIARIRGVQAPLPYMDKLLSEWHAKGLSTREDCLADLDMYSKKRKDQSDDKPARSRDRSQPQTPKYGNFDAGEAFKRALMRSYDTSGDTEEKK